MHIIPREKTETRKRETKVQLALYDKDAWLKYMKDDIMMFEFDKTVLFSAKRLTRRLRTDLFPVVVERRHAWS